MSFLISRSYILLSLPLGRFTAATAASFVIVRFAKPSICRFTAATAAACVGKLCSSQLSVTAAKAAS